MAEITLKAEPGRPTGSRSSRRLLATGKIPAVVYGQGAEPLSVAVDWHDLRAALTTDAGLNALLSLRIDGAAQLSIVKELQRHPTRGTVTHVDFLRIRADELLTVEVPILLQGDAEEVARENGMVDHVLFNLPIQAKPADIPNELVIDISHMTLGDTLRVSDLTLPSGVSTEVDPDEAIAIATITRSTLEAEAEEAAAEAEAEAEGAEAEGEEGEGREGGEADAGSDGGGASDEG